MSAKEVIQDYGEHSEEIEKWLELKGETKYMRFVGILQKQNEPIMWTALRDTYRYDKRLLVNLFKYLSFLEEFLRALVWNFKKDDYDRLEKTYLRLVIDEVIANNISPLNVEFSVEALNRNKDLVNYLRNRVSHNKIILESKKGEHGVKDIIQSVKQVLPTNYQAGFASDINNCITGLCVPKSFVEAQTIRASSQIEALFIFLALDTVSS